MSARARRCAKFTPLVCISLTEVIPRRLSSRKQFMRLCRTVSSVGGEFYRTRIARQRHLAANRKVRRFSDSARISRRQDRGSRKRFRRPPTRRYSAARLRANIEYKPDDSERVHPNPPASEIAFRRIASAPSHRQRQSKLPAALSSPLRDLSQSVGERLRHFPMELAVPAQSGCGRVNMGINQSWDNRTARQVDDPGPRTNQRAHIALGADSDETAILDRHGFANREITIDGNDFPAAQNQISRSFDGQRAREVHFATAATPNE